MIILTDRQRSVLAHVVIDPDAWLAHSEATRPESAQADLEEKVARWADDYDASITTLGTAYQTRAERDA